MFQAKHVMCAAVGATAIAAGSNAAVRQVPRAYPTIQAAVNAAHNGDVVLVADGTYTGAGNRDIDLLGKAITLRSANGPAATTIDIQATANESHTGFALHMQETSATVIQGFTVKGGYNFDGGAMHLSGSSPTVRDCVFTQNSSSCWGAAMYYDGNSSPIVSDCEFVKNACAADGGAIFGFNGAPKFINCLIAGNTAGSTAGAILSFGAESPSMVNCTVVGNSASWGSAVYSNNLKISNSIISGNTGSEEQIATFSGSAMTVKYSIVEGGFAGQGNLDVTPQFMALDSGDFHLAAGSPGIDAGDPAMKSVPGEFDADGDPRVFGSAVDMGIDEFRKTGDATGDHAVNIDDLLAVIAAWGPCSWSMADLNGSFAVNIDDLLIVINHWE
jgi:hypothetical protein